MAVEAKFMVKEIIKMMRSSLLKRYFINAELYPNNENGYHYDACKKIAKYLYNIGILTKESDYQFLATVTLAQVKQAVAEGLELNDTRYPVIFCRP